MANYANTKSIIAQNIYTNHEGKVTAEMVKTAANEIVNTLIAGGYLYAGVAKLTPTQTNPGSPDANVFYIATEPGTYTNFVGAGGSLVVADGEVAVLKYNGTWSKEVTGAATAAKVTELGQNPFDKLKFYIVGNNVFVKKSGNDFIITSNSNLIVFDWLGGYYIISSFTVTLGSGKFLFLSSVQDSVVEPNFKQAGAGGNLYLVPSNRQDVGINKQCVCAINHGGAYYPQFDCFAPEKSGFWTNANFRVFQSGTSAVFTIPSNAFCIYDYKGGYRTLAAGTHTISSGKFLFISATQNDYTPVNLSTPGNGETVYIYTCGRAELPSMDLSGFLGFCYLGKILHNDGFENSERAATFWFNAIVAVKKNGTNASFTIPSPSFSIYDTSGGYRTLAAGNYTISSGEFMFLSATENSYTPVDFSVAGNGQTMYINKCRRTDLPNRDINGFLGFCQAGRILHNDGFINNDLPLNLQRENDGILPPENFSKSPLELNVYSHLQKKDKNITIIHLGDSISTNGNYASDLSDAPYRPPRMDEDYHIAKIEEQLRWKGQEYRRSDAKTEKGGNTNMFTENGTGENKYYDAAWDWQFENPADNYYRLWTRVLTGTAESPASVAFTIPAGIKRAAFIYRTDYLCASDVQVTLPSNGIARIVQADGTLVEANGYAFSMQEADEVLTKSITTYDGNTINRNLRKSSGQVRLEFHIDNTTAPIAITIANTGAGRLNYWGVEYSPYTYLFRYINMARGAHNLAALKCFEEWDVDAFKPDMIVFECPIINEGAMSVVAASTPNTPPVFAERFTNRFAEILAKSYTPELFTYILYIGSQANIVSQSTGKYNCSLITSYGFVDVYKYIGILETELESDNIDLANCFNRFNEIAYRKAKNDGTDNIWTSAISGSGKTGESFTVDNVHLNDYGNLIAWRLLMQYFNP